MTWLVKTYAIYPIQPIFNLTPKRASMTEDETWAPRGQFEALCALDPAIPANGFLHYLQPAQTEPIIVEVSPDEYTTWQLILRESDIDWNAWTIKLTAETGECLLQDYNRPYATAHTFSSLAVADVIEDIIDMATGGSYTIFNATTGGSYTVDSDFKWPPGANAWQLIQSLAAPAGWVVHGSMIDAQHFMITDAPAAPAGTLALDGATNVTRARSTSSRDRAEWADAVIVRYRWTDSSGVAQEAVDVASTGSAADARKTVTLDRQSPYPGPGAAQAILDRIIARANRQTLRAINDYTAYPGNTTTFNSEQGPAFFDRILQSVAWRFPENEMDLTFRGDPT